MNIHSLTLAVCGASEGLDVLVIDAESPGGQAASSSRIENYLGFPTGISGQELAGRAAAQEAAAVEAAVAAQVGRDKASASSRSELPVSILTSRLHGAPTTCYSGKSGYTIASRTCTRK
jgi:thioredoxin reductase